MPASLVAGMVAVSLALVARFAQSSPDVAAVSSGLGESATADRAGHEPASRPERITIRLTSERGKPRWSIGGRRYRDLKKVREIVVQLAAIEPRCRVVLDVAGEVPLGDTVDLVDLCKNAGFAAVQFAIGERDVETPDPAKDQGR
jgi:hypothetical protein